MRNFLLVFSILLASCSGNKETVNPKVKRLVEAVYASGHVVARNQYTVFAQADGYVIEKVAVDGSTVGEGSPLYILESGQSSSRFVLARKNYELAKRNYEEGSPVLSEARAALDLSESRLRHDSINALRFENLWQRKATTKAEYDRARLAYETSQNEYRLQRSRHRRIRDQLYLELENARNQLAVAGDESGKHVVRSEIAGKVFKTLKEESELVRRGEAVAIVGDSSEFYLQLSIDELDINKVEAGQSVLVTIDAFPDQIFKAKLDKIYPFVNQQQQTLRADAQLEEPLPAFYSGLAVEANIVIRESNSALVIPRTALLPGDSLIVSAENGEKKISVKTGIQTLEEVEILDGVDTKTEIIIK